MASQDSWAKPLAKQLVDLFRVNSFNYIRMQEPVYDPMTGEVTGGETVYASAGAVTKSGKMGEGSVGKSLYLEAWLDTAGIDEQFPTTDDLVEYNGRKWNIVSVDPQYSGDVLYAAKIRAEC